MKIEITTEIDVNDIGNSIYDLPRSWQIDVLIALLKSVDTETARRAIARWEEN